jgi:hypothetical protein
VTGWFGSVSLQGTLVKCGSGWQAATSALGPGGIRTSDSSRSYTGAASTIGTEEVTLVEYGHLIRTNPKWGPEGAHIWMRDIIDGVTYCGVCGVTQ